jgi:hypothetical protein
MESARVIRELSRRRWLLGLGVLIAAAVAVLSIYRFEGGHLKARSLQYSAASTEVLVDSNSSLLGNVSQAAEPLVARAQVFANFMTSPTLLEAVGAKVGLLGGQIYAAGPVNANEPRVEQEPTALKRNVEITGETKPYKLNFESQQNLPTITIYSQAPTTAMAVNLANGAASSLQEYVKNEEASTGVAPRSRVVIRWLGPAKGAVVDGGVSKSLALIVFIVVFAVWCLLILMGSRFRAAWRETGEQEKLPNLEGEAAAPLDPRDREVADPIGDGIYDGDEHDPRAAAVEPPAAAGHRLR